MAAVSTLLMWSGYAVFGSLASRVHGETVNIIIEVVAMMVIVILAISRAGLGDFQKVTTLSLVHASIMGVLSAGGLFLQFYAFRVAPQNEQGAVVMISGMFPVLAVIIFSVMAMVGLSGGSLATPRQWLGVVMGGVALWLISTK